MNIYTFNVCRLKPELTADHAAKAGTARPAAADLTLQEQVAVFIADGDAAGAAVALVVGVEHSGEAGRRDAGVGEANSLHW